MACSNTCRHAIKIITDAEGFIRPFLVKERCTECGRCTAVCPVLHPLRPERLCSPKVFACAHADEPVRLSSASGGVFAAIAQAVIQRHGIVFGAATNEHMQVGHTAIERQEDVCLLQQSKYVQSDLGHCFAAAKKNLEIERTVLFSGTPCQIAGLYACLGKDYTNLYTVDILCKGAPSPGIFEIFIRSQEKRYYSALRSFSFRVKKQGHAKAMSIFRFADGTQRELPLTQTSFGSGFSTNLFLRPSCYQCAYRNPHRIGDISLGDFWGLSRDSSFYHDRHKGVSLVMLNSAKGKALFESAGADTLRVEERLLEEAVSHSSALQDKIFKNRFRGLFFKTYNRYPHLALSLFTLPHRMAVRLRSTIESCLKRPRCT
jgi:coenzyme F420-reducing hydrogenase beta subunit